MKHPVSSSVLSNLCLTFAFVAFVLSAIILGLRTDGEAIQVTNSTQSSITVPGNSNLSLFVCMPEPRQDQIPSSIVFESADDNIELISADMLMDEHHDGGLSLMEPRPLDLPADFASDHQLDPHQMCGVSSPLMVRNTGLTAQKADLSFDTPTGALVVAAVSEQKGNTLALIALMIFLLSLWAGIALRYKPEFPKIPRFARYDGIIGFFASLLLSFAFAYIFELVIPANTGLLPKYGDMFILLMTNFMSFILVFAAFCILRTYRPLKHTAKKLHQISKTNETPEPNNTTNSESVENSETNQIHEIQNSVNDSALAFKSANYPLRALGLGLVVSVTAAISVSFAPIPGLTVIEMASQLTSTLFMTSLFAILAGVSEEFLFRGLIQSSLEARPDSRHPLAENIFAVGFAASLFVIVHVPQSLEHLWALIPIGLVAITAGILKLRSRSIFPAILLHMTYNSVLLLPSVWIALF